MTSNYDRQQEMARQLFLREDMEAVARRFALEADADYLYIPFFHRRHRLSRTTAAVEELAEGVWRPAGFNAHLSLYDALSRPGTARLSGRWSGINQMGNMRHPGVGEAELYAPYLAPFSHRQEDLLAACRQMGDQPFPVGDVGWVLEAFPFLPLVFQFWEGDEEFPPQLRLLWDFNSLDFVRYETAWYIAVHALERIRAMLQ